MRSCFWRLLFGFSDVNSLFASVNHSITLVMSIPRNESGWRDCAPQQCGAQKWWFAIQRICIAELKITSMLLNAMTRDEAALEYWRTNIWWYGHRMTYCKVLKYVAREFFLRNILKVVNSIVRYMPRDVFCASMVLRRSVFLASMTVMLPRDTRMRAQQFCRHCRCCVCKALHEPRSADIFCD